MFVGNIMGWIGQSLTVGSTKGISRERNSADGNFIWQFIGDSAAIYMASAQSFRP
jgi:hypothetical protein